MKIFITTALLAAVIFSAGCSSGVDPSLQQQIDYKSASTEELLENYEDLNEELVEVIEEKNYYYKKLIKAKNAYREVSSKINSRKKRLDSAVNPKVEEGQATPAVDSDQVESHKERLTEYEEELAEVQADIDEYLAKTKELTAKALELRTGRNRAYKAYINSRNELKELNKKASQPQS